MEIIMKKIKYCFFCILTVSICFTFTSCDLINRFVDNEDKEDPHEHTYIDGECSCGELDSDYVPPHSHVFSDGECECGSLDPDYPYSLGLKYQISADRAFYVLAGIGECKDTDIIVPSTYKGLPIRSIISNAFMGNDKITSLSFAPDSSVVAIYDNAFRKCVKLSKVTFPSSLQSIGEYAFYGCCGFSQINLPEGLLSISRAAFCDAYGLAKVILPDSLNTIGASAFQGCRALTSITIPENVTTIGRTAFYGCDKLYLVENKSSLKINYDNDYDNGGLSLHARLIVDKDGNKTYKTGFENFEYFDTPDGFRFVKGVDGNYWMLSYLGDEDTVTLPVNVNGCDYKMNRVDGIRNVIIPKGAVKIDAEAFYESTVLESVLIPDSMVELGDGAFALCCNLKTVTLPDNCLIKKIPYRAFYGCGRITSITIPSSVEVIGEEAFSACDEMTDVIFEKGSNLVAIEKKAFAGSDQLIKISLPMGLKKIGNSAFYGCKNITSVRLPDSVEVLGAYAFSDCEGLNSVYLSKNIKEIKEQTFYRSGIKSIVIPEGVTVIGNSAFSGCYYLKSIVIPKTVSEIGERVFESCESLTNMYYSGTSEEWSRIRVSSAINHTILNYNYVPKEE